MEWVGGFTLLPVCPGCREPSHGRMASSDSRGTLWLASSPLTLSDRCTPGWSCCRTCTCSCRRPSPGSGLEGCQTFSEQVKTHQTLLLLWASSPVSLAATGERRSADVPATDEPGHRPEHGVRAQALTHQPVRLRRVCSQTLLRSGKLKF